MDRGDDSLIVHRFTAKDLKRLMRKFNRDRIGFWPVVQVLMLDWISVMQCQMLTRLHAVAIIGALCAAVAGCGGAKVDEGGRLSGAEAFAAAVGEFDQRSYEAAAEHFTTSITKGGLNPDQYGEAGVKRAVCWGAAGKYAEALAELDKLLAGAPNLDQVHAARAFVLKKQGKSAEAAQALASARRINRTIKEFQ